MPRLSCSVLALAIATGPVCAQSADPSSADDTTAVPEIIVTAQRREQRLEDVPLAITALTAADLEQRQITSLADYASSVASVAFTESGGFGNEVKIRGIGSGTVALSPTVSVYLGEVPIIHTGRNVNSSYDFRVADMTRIEVLNGPQGQLYGANSLGGAIKYIPHAADLGKFEGRLSAGGAMLRSGSSDYDAEGTINLPLGESAALRVVAYGARTGGYYDNVFAGGPAIGSLLLRFPPGPPGSPPPPPPMPIPGLSAAQQSYRAPPNVQENGNAIDTVGVRALFSWQPTERLTVDLMALNESKQWDGASYAELVPGVTNASRFQYNDVANSPGRDRLNLANFVVSYALGGATLTSSSSWWSRRTALSNDFSEIPAFFGYPNVLPINSGKLDEPTSWTQEFRAASTGEGRLQWLGGVFFNRTDQDFALRLEDLSGLNIFAVAQNAVRAMFGAPPSGSDYPGRLDAKYRDEQIAVFGEGRYEFVDGLSAAISFRAFRLTQTFASLQSGVLFNVAPGPGLPGAPFASTGRNRDNIFTPKYQLVWMPSDNQTLYATVAKGYRTGVVNVPPPPALCGNSLIGLGFPVTGVPASKSDTVWNHEVGANLSFAQRRVQVSAAAFVTNWRDIQGTVFLDPTGQFCPYTAIANVGDARSKGAELKVAARIAPNVSVDFAGSYTDAKYTRIEPIWAANSANFGAKVGDTIQMTPRYILNAGVDFDVIGGPRPTTLRLSWNYIGRMQGAPADFTSRNPFTGLPNYPGGPPVKIGDYSLFNASVNAALTDNLSAELYVRNIGDKRGVTFATDLGGATPPTLNIVRPRTIGARLNFDF